MLGYKQVNIELWSITLSFIIALTCYDNVQFRAGKRHMNVDTGPGSSKIVFTFICKAITDYFFFSAS